MPLYFPFTVWFLVIIDSRSFAKLYTLVDVMMYHTPNAI